jgi:hypothetical protein
MDKVIQIGRLRWLGHFFGMRELDHCRKLTQTEGTTHVEKSRWRWFESVEEELKNMGASYW